jgi:hypothetical protein
MLGHVKEIHKFDKNGPVLLQDGENRIKTVFGNGLPRIAFNQDLFKQLLIQWIVTNHISFSQVENKSFRLLLMYLSACVSIPKFRLYFTHLTCPFLLVVGTSSYTVIGRCLPRSENTVRSWILTAFNVAKESLKSQLITLDTTIHYSCDLWTSPNHRAFLGIVAHWVDKGGALRSTVLGMQRFKGRHTGKTRFLIFGVWFVTMVLSNTLDISR